MSRCSVRPLQGKLTPAFQENWPLSYLTYALLEGYLLYVAVAVYQRRWHAPPLCTGENVRALAAFAVATCVFVTFHPIVYYGEILTPNPLPKGGGYLITYNVIEVSWYM